MSDDISGITWSLFGKWSSGAPWTESDADAIREDLKNTRDSAQFSLSAIENMPADGTTAQQITKQLLTDMLEHIVSAVDATIILLDQSDHPAEKIFTTGFTLALAMAKAAELSTYFPWLADRERASAARRKGVNVINEASEEVRPIALAKVGELVAGGMSKRQAVDQAHRETGYSARSIWRHLPKR